MNADLLDRRLLFVTGKGGVGKTTVAAALGLLAAGLGKRTLVCEVDAKGNMAEFLEGGDLEFTARELQPGLYAMAMSTEASLREYLRLQLKVPLLARIGPLARTLDFIATAAPGVKEILTVGKLAYEVREQNYDLVVVDAAATGHVVGQLAAPKAIAELVKVGRVQHQTAWMGHILADPATTGAVLVAGPAEMAVSETLDLWDRIGTETDVDVAAVVVNRVLPELFGRGEEQVFERLQEPEAVAILAGETGGSVETVLDAAELAVRLRRNGAAHLSNLRDGLPAELPVLYVPELFGRSHGARATRQVADALAEELDV